MNKKDTDRFKTKLMAEKATLETELNKVGQQNNGTTNAWEATSGTIEVDSADENEVADKFEEYEGNQGIVKQLQSQLDEVNSALERIEAGTYGVCEICGKPIEPERLEANPSAKNSIKHGH